MSRLSIRCYKSKDQGTSWTLLGTSDNPEKVEGWIRNHGATGLVLHTGFAVLPRDILVELIPKSLDGLVYCAATKAVMSFPSEFFTKNASLCRELTSHGTVETELMSNWFLLCSLRQSNGNNVSEIEQESETDAGVNIEIEDNDFDIFLLDALKHRPKLLTSLKLKKITTVPDFQKSWSLLNDQDAYDIGKALMEQAQASYRDLINTKKPSKSVAAEMCAGVVRMACTIPGWCDSIPHLNARLNNVLRANGIKHWSDFYLVDPRKLLRMANMGLTSVKTLFTFLLDYMVMPPNYVASSTTVTSNFNASHIQPMSEYDLSETTSTTRKDTEIDRRPTSIQPHTEWATKISTYTMETAPTLSEAIVSLVQGFTDLHQGATKHYAEALRDRLKGKTLEAIATDQGVTRERIRQIVAKVTKRIASKILAPTSTSGHLLPLIGLSEVIQQYFSKESCSIAEFNQFVHQFSETETLKSSSVVASVLQAVLSHKSIGFFSMELAGTSVLLPVPFTATKQRKAQLTHAKEKICAQLIGLTAQEGLVVAAELYEGIVGNAFIASVLAVNVVHHESVIDAEGRLSYPNLVSLKHTVIKEVLAILRQAGRPMHGVDEIHTAMPITYQESVGERRLYGHIEAYQSECPSDSDDYIFTMGRGKYCLWEHMGIEHEHARQCTQLIEAHLLRNSGRQYFDKDLYEILDQAHMVTWGGDHVDCHRTVSIMLTRFRPPNVRYMGRFVWTAGSWTDNRDTENRYQVYDLIKRLIKEQGRPVTKEKIDEYIDQFRGRGVDQIHEINGIIRLTGSGKSALYWLDSMDPEPFDSVVVSRLRKEIVDVVHKGGTINIHSLKTDVSYISDIASKYNAYQFLALLLRIPEITIENGKNTLVVKASTQKIEEAEQ